MRGSRALSLSCGPPIRPPVHGSSLFRRGPPQSLPRARPPHRPCRRAFTKLGETSTYLKEADREIYLVGTAHISSASAREVADLIQQVKPDFVAVELCEQRYQKVKEMPSDAGKPHNFAESVQAVLSAVGKHGPLAGVFVALNEAMRNTGLVPGVDFKSAIDAAEQVGAKVVLIDRNIDDTMRLLHEALPKLSLLKILTTPDPPELKGLSQAAAESGSAAYEQLKQRDKLRALKAHLSQVAEPVVEVMLHQRDRYMVWQLGSQCPRGKVVVVVGMAHMDGIEKEWREKHQDDSRRDR